MMYHIRNGLILIFLISSTAFAGGRYAGASMELGIGARPLSLGGAAVSLIGSAESFYYNPASLAFIKRPVISLMYAPSFGSITSPLASYHFAGLAFPLPNGGTVAAGWTRFAVDEIPIFPKLRGDSYADRLNDTSQRPDGVALGYFQDVEDVFYFSFAKPIDLLLPLGWLFTELPVEIPFGLNLKLLRQKIYDAKASGLGIDAGTIVHFSLGQLFDHRSLGEVTVGLSALDVSQTNIVWNTKKEERIHRTVMWGVGYQQTMGFWDAKWTFYWTRYSKYESTDLFGTEFVIKGLSIRLGKNRTGLTAGTGLHLWRLRLDYAFVTLDLDNSHRLNCAITL